MYSVAAMRGSGEVFGHGGALGHASITRLT